MIEYRAQHRMQESVLQENRVIRNTYLLLSLTLLFSAATAWLSMSLGGAGLNPMLNFLLAMGVLFALQTQQNTVFALPLVFAFTGLFGFSLGPMLAMYLKAFSNGPQLIATALGGTGVLFLGLSGYAMSAERNFSYMSGFIAITSITLLGAVIAGLFFHSPILQLAIISGFMVMSSASILYETSQIIHGGQRNYVMATVSLYLSIYNLFVSLLQLLAAFSGRRD